MNPIGANALSTHKKPLTPLDLCCCEPWEASVMVTAWAIVANMWPWDNPRPGSPTASHTIHHHQHCLRRPKHCTHGPLLYVQVEKKIGDMNIGTFPTIVAQCTER